MAERKRASGTLAETTGCLIRIVTEGYYCCNIDTKKMFINKYIYM